MLIPGLARAAAISVVRDVDVDGILKVPTVLF